MPLPVPEGGTASKTWMVAESQNRSQMERTLLLNHTVDNARTNPSAISPLVQPALEAVTPGTMLSDWQGSATALMKATQTLADYLETLVREEAMSDTAITRLDQMLAEREGCITQMQQQGLGTLGITRPVLPEIAHPEAASAKGSEVGTLTLSGIFETIHGLEAGINLNLNQLLGDLGRQLHKTSSSRRKVQGYRIAPPPIEMQTDGKKA